MSALALAVLGALLAGASDPPPAVPRPLVPGQETSALLRDAETHAYEVTLRDGEFLRLTVVQEGADVVVAVVAPDGTRTETDAATEPWWAERVSVLAGRAGTYRIELRASSGLPVPGYRIVSEPARTATEDDRVRFRAERGLAEGSALALQGGDARAAARVRLEAALADWTALGDRQGAALTTLKLVDTFYVSVPRDYPAMLRAVPAAIEAARGASDRSCEARAVLWRGIAELGVFDPDASLVSLEQALALERQNGNRRGELDVMGFMSEAYSARGEPRKVVEIEQRRLAQAREMGDHGREIDVTAALGKAYANADELQSALDSFRAAAAGYREMQLPEYEAVNLNNAASVRDALGDHAAALATFEESLAVYVALGSRGRQASTYSNMGLSASALSDSARAMELFERALRLFREVKDRRGECRTLQRIGDEYNTRRDYVRAAETLDPALPVCVEIRQPRVEARVRMALGTARRGAGRTAEARELFQRALDLAPDEPTLVAQALYEIARVDREAGRLDDARREVERAIQEQETVRSQIASATLRATFASESRRTRQLHVDVLMALHQREPGQGLDARALEASELARARGLVDLLNEGGLREGVGAALLDQERGAREKLSAAVNQQQRLAASPHTPEQEHAAARAVDRLTTEWDVARERVRAASPRFAALREPPAIDLARIRRDVLDADTVLLEYALGETRSFLWVVGVEGLDAYELPPQSDIEAAARSAYKAWSDPGRRGGGAGAARRLGRMILAPAAPRLKGKRLLIVADGALHYVPFGALPDPNGTGPLIAAHEIVSAPSAAVIALLREEDTRRRKAPRTLAVLADPVFTRDDERVPGPARSARPVTEPPRGPLAAALRDSGAGALPRLRFTRREGNNILALVPAPERKAAFGFEASRATATDPALADYRFVHFATHGFLNATHPELSGIVLSLVDRQGADDAGFLTTSDVFSLHLNAEMVTLSGCRTALGQEVRGEGLVGLARGFMYAGSPRVLASLWEVYDAVTAALMKRVYQEILSGHRTPAAALRAAQLDLMRQPRYRDPFYWAAFQLQGEWR